MTDDPALVPKEVFHVAIGMVSVIPFLVRAEGVSLKQAHRELGWSLIAAALVYVGFALTWRRDDMYWLIVEGSGVVIYGCFYFMSILLDNLYFLALGWLLHPVWDYVLHSINLDGAQHTPHWYVWACISFDVVVASYIVRRISTEKRKKTV